VRDVWGRGEEQREFWQGSLGKKRPLGIFSRRKDHIIKKDF
jgi:hypothetical protein